MSAYLEWLQKQETKVRRPAKSHQASTVASRAKSAVETAYDIDLAEASDAYKSWLQRREARLAAAEQATVEKETPCRDSKKIIADAVSKYTLLAKVASESKKRPLPKASSSIAAKPAATAAVPNAALLSKAAADSKKRPLSKASSSTTSASSAASVTARVVKPAPKTSTASTSARDSNSKGKLNILERLLAGHVTHRRKRGIDDVEAPSKPSSAPLKHRKVHEETKYNNNNSSSSHSNEEDAGDENDAGHGVNTMKKKRTSLDKALAKIDKKYGTLVTLQDYSLATGSVDTRHPSSQRRGIEEVQYWNAVDRFASLY